MSMCGQICYGISFDEGYEFPWNIKPWGGDHEAWWRDVSGYEGLEYPYAKDGSYKPGFHQDDPRVQEFFKHRRTWDEENPFPLELVYIGDFNSAETILAVTSSLVCAEYSAPFDPTKLVVYDGARNVLLDFCRMWNIKSDHPKWWLSTYQG